MNKYLLYSIILILIIPLVYSSTSCSIFPSLNCSCFQSDVDLNSTLSIKIYSHLYCQGNSLTEKTFQSPFGSDFKQQNYFRTVSIEFSIEDRIEIQSNQFDSLGMLFSETSINAQIDIYLRFNGFKHITFNKNSLTPGIFQQKHQNKRLWIHLIPVRSNLTQIELDDENSTKIEDQFNFSSNCFSGIIVSQLTMYIHTVRDRFPLSYSFEQIFNNTNIGELHFHGSIIRPNSLSTKQNFKGVVRSLTLHRHVDTIDSYNFPYYSHVYSYTIHSIEAHSMNLSSFIPSYTNLRGLEIIKPRFDVSIDQLLPTLDSLTLDIEDLNEKTLFAARHVYNLKLGSHLRRINPEIFNSLLRRLHHLDLSDIDLSQMASESRCHLIKYLSKNSQQQLNIIFPRIENLTECDCARLFLDYIQLNEHLQKKNHSTCSKLCRFSDCQIISEYFTEKHPLVINQYESILISNQTITEKNNMNEHLQSVDIFSDLTDVDMMTFLINQTHDHEEQKQTTTSIPTFSRQTTTSIPTFSRQTTTSIPTLIGINMNNISVIENIQEYDDTNIFSTPNLLELTTNYPINEHKTELVHPNENESFSWLSFFIGIAVVFLLLIILSFIIFFIIRYRKEHNFKPVPVYV